MRSWRKVMFAAPGPSVAAPWITRSSKVSQVPVTRIGARGRCPARVLGLEGHPRRGLGVGDRLDLVGAVADQHAITALADGQGFGERARGRRVVGRRLGRALAAAGAPADPQVGRPPAAVAAMPATTAAAATTADVEHEQEHGSDHRAGSHDGDTDHPCSAPAHGENPTAPVIAEAPLRLHGEEGLALGHARDPRRHRHRRLAGADPRHRRRVPARRRRLRGHAPLRWPAVRLR